MFTVVERFQQGKLDAAHYEDGLVVTPAYAAVIDGSTSKGDYDWGKETSGSIARDVLSDGIRALQAGESLTTILQSLTERLNQHTQTITQQPATVLSAWNRLTASVVLYSDTLKKVWQIGDCPCLADGKLHDNSKPREAQLAALRSRVLEKALSEGRTTEELLTDDIGRKTILKELKAECAFQNKTFALFDGTPVYTPGIKTIDVSNCKELVLASDGYPFLYPTLRQSEDALSTLLKKDPLCIRLFKATKGLRPGYHSFDDRTYLRIRLS